MKSGEDPKAVLRHGDRLLKEAAKTLCLHIQCTSMAFSAFGLIHNLIRKTVGAEEAREFEIRMIGDFHDMTTAEQGIAIWDLAQTAAKENPVRMALFADASADEVIKRWKRGPETSSFLKLWDAFLSRFGHRGTEEFELSVPHWDEDPSIVFQMMREIINHQLPDPRERLHRQQKAALHDTRSMIDRIALIGSYWEAFLFRHLIQTYYKMVLGDNLKQSGIIEDRDDIFFMEYHEIVDLIEKRAPATFDAMSRVAERKTAHEEHARMVPPDMWVSSDGRESPLKLFSSSQNSTVLHGIGCSPGQITGRACVLTSVQESVVTEQGRILVAPSIDPGLTPLFLSAIGVVTEIGGILSHGATVAREYGLPAVVGVPHATKIIQNGQQITVDGSTGLVHLGPATG
jgi:pyruvate,water dikinase